MSYSNLVFHNLQYTNVRICISYDLQCMVISDLVIHVVYMVTYMTTQHMRYVLFVSIDK